MFNEGQRIKYSTYEGDGSIKTDYIDGIYQDGDTTILELSNGIKIKEYQVIERA